MMVTIRSWMRGGRGLLRRLAARERSVAAIRGLGYFLAGLLLSPASLAGRVQPLCLGLLCAVQPGLPLLLTGLGSMTGYWLFWGRAGYQALVWTGCGMIGAGLLAGRKIAWHAPLLLPALSSLITAASGLAFQLWLEDTTPVLIYVLRVVLAFAAARIFTLAFESRNPFVDWLVEGMAVLALSQLTVTPWLGLGFAAAGALAAGGAFPAAALAGLALDLSRITPVPMTAVLCLGYLARLLPRVPRRVVCLFPTAAYLLVMGLCGTWDLHPLPGLAVGSVLGLVLPERSGVVRRRGEVGVAQVRLELVAEVLARTEQTLLETPEIPVDEQAIITRAAERACGTCPCRKTCRDREHVAVMSPSVLHRSLLRTIDVPIPCRKVGRLTMELQRGQEQLRAIHADRESRRDYREALIQQYQFLSGYLRSLSDHLAAAPESAVQRYQPEVAVCSVGKEQANGDRCLWFAGTGCRYYVLLCDGMGTGLGAAQEARSAGDMIRRLLTAGFPAEYALRSLNSLCALRGRAGAVTVDLAEIRLDTGTGTLYKWGAMPSYLLSRSGAEKIGTAGAPPGLSVTEVRETADRLSLRRGETLIMLSDGVDGEDVLGRSQAWYREPPGEIAASVVETVDEAQADDATAAVIRLGPLSSDTQ